MLDPVFDDDPVEPVWEPSDLQVSWARVISDPPEPGAVSLLQASKDAEVDCRDLLAQIRACSDKEARRVLKDRLPVVSPSVVCVGSFAAESVVSHSGVIYLDVDDVGESRDEVTRVYEVVREWPYAWRCGISPGGRGLFVWVLLEEEPPVERGALVEWHAERWAWARHCFEEEFPKLVVDGQTKDLSRRQFLGSKAFPGGEQLSLPAPPEDWGAPREPDVVEVREPAVSRFVRDSGEARDRYRAAGEAVAVSGLVGDRGEWLRFSYACADPETGLSADDWDGWCRRNAGYRQGQIRDWDGFVARRRGVSAATLIWMARELCGWEDPWKAKPPPRAGDVAQPAAAAGIEMTDSGAAARLAKDHPDLMFVPELGKWFRFDGSYWFEDHKELEVSGAVEALGVRVQRIAADLPAKDPDRKSLARFGDRLRMSRGTADVVRQARTTFRVPVSKVDSPETRWLLAFPNGVTVDLRDGSARRSRAEDRITMCANVPYDPSADEPEVHRFLEEIMPDPEDRLCLIRLLAYSMIGEVMEHVFVFAIGKGANGKTTLFEVVRYVFGSYTASLPIEYLLLKRGSSPHSTGIADLRGKRFVLAAESAEGNKLDVGRVKALTGGDRVKARHMRQDNVEFDATATPWLASNSLPRINDTSEGIWRRARVVEFQQQFSGDEVDVRLPAKLRTVKCAQTLVNIIVAGAEDYLKRGLDMSPTFEAAAEEYRRDEDLWNDFLEYSGLEMSPDLWMKLSQVVDHVKSWRESDSLRPWSQKYVTRLLKAHSCVPGKRGGVRGWYGIGRPEPAPEEEAGRPVLDALKF